MMCGFFFFFQAEDGIRDDLVTGVQTCALPISGLVGARREEERACGHADEPRAEELSELRIRQVPCGLRSEERRVGKECRSRGSQQHLKKKNNNEIHIDQRVNTTLTATR